MADSMLRDILAIEKKIAADLAEERERARIWLKQEKEEIDRRAEADLEEAASIDCRREERRCQAARDESARRLRAMRKRLHELHDLPEERLRLAVRQHLTVLWGGDENDHPDDES